MVIAAMKLKDAYSLKGSYDQPGQHIEKQRHHFANKGPCSQGYGFSCGHVWTGKPGMLQSMGSQGVGHDLSIILNTGSKIDGKT